MYADGKVYHVCSQSSDRLTVVYRIVNMTLGRIPSFHGDLKIPMFSAVDDEYLTNGSHQCFQPEGTISRTTFALHNVKLCELLGQILNLLYQQNMEGENEAQSSMLRNSEPNFNSIASLENSLSSFEKELPPELRWDNGGRHGEDVPRLFLRQRCVLHARYVGILRAYSVRIQCI